jgi:hypothetical protein
MQSRFDRPGKKDVAVAAISSQQHPAEQTDKHNGSGRQDSGASHNRI